MNDTNALPEAVEAALAELLHAQLLLGVATAKRRPTPDAPEVLAASKALVAVCDAVRATLAQQPAASGETVAYLVRDVGGKRGTGMLVRACDIDSYQRATLEREPLYIAQPAPARVPIADDPWHKLYRRAINEANGLTNYVEDRPELRSAERRLTAIEAEARTLAAAATPAQGGAS